jgi:hypothetical protein
MMMSELKRVQRGQKFLQKNDVEESDEGEEMNLME